MKNLESNDGEMGLLGVIATNLEVMTAYGNSTKNLSNLQMGKFLTFLKYYQTNNDLLSPPLLSIP